ncbi:MAG: DNA polymerase III subunit gamma/tau, partial [Synergistaceae bacterium]|nr:DNA polymerase III subunit gamma/tau [Synergistaceae bacterium]
MEPTGGRILGISLYRRYRPQRFSEVAGQKTAVDVIVRSLERSRVGHAYLFSGPRGCGKTTVARLLAKALNCLSPVKGEGGGKNAAEELRACEPCCECKNCLAIAAGESLDVIEIDGASNNSVDEVRELKSHVTLAPFSSLYKVYIVDEVHMLSISAFNALLKTLEEPPAYVVFILATTEAHKVPVTIRSRCQHIPFRRIGARDIYDRLVRVSAAEGLAYQTEALWEIARQADGALRDALSMLEQAANLGRSEIALSDVETTLGQGSRPTLERWLSGWRAGEAETFLELDRMLAGGASPQRFLEELFALVRNLWLTARWSGVLAALDASDQEKEYLKTESPLWDPRELASVMDFLSELLPQVRQGLRIDVLSGLLMAKMVRLKEGEESKPSEPAPRGRAAAIARKTPAPQEPPIPKPSIPKPPIPKPPIPETPFSEISSSEMPSAPPFSPGRPCPAEQWDAALEALRGQEFVLYCALLEAVPVFSEKSEKTDAETGGAVLVLDVANRYCYEVLRLDRNRAFLKNGLEPFAGGAEVVLRHGNLWVSCQG